MEDKCFCHLNEYKVKDADARNSIIQILNRLDELEANGGSGNGTPGEVIQQEFKLEDKGIFFIDLTNMELPSRSGHSGDGRKQTTDTTILANATNIITKMKEIYDETSTPNFYVLAYIGTDYYRKGSFVFTCESYTSNQVDLITELHRSGYIYSLQIQSSNNVATRVSIAIKNSGYGFLTTNNSELYNVSYSYSPVHKQYLEQQLGSLNNIPVKTYIDGLQEDILLAQNMLNNFTSKNARTLVWENASVSSIEQTNITFIPYTDENDNIIPITHIEVIYANGGTKALFSSGVIPLINGIKNLRLEGITSSKMSFREIKLNDDLLGATINNGRIINSYTNTNDYTNSGDVCIPVQIYAYYNDIQTLEGGE